MNKKIFNIGRVLSFFAVAALALTSCETDTDSNPTFQPNTTGFQLNVPANATNNTYDLATAESLNLTCQQPDYGGFPVVVDYHVQVSLEADFSIYRELETYYRTASMNVEPMEINNAMLELYQEANGDVEYPAEARALYIRLRAVVDGQEQLGETFSNTITLPSVLATYVPPTLELPTSLYVVGSSIGANYWSDWKPMAPVYGSAGEFYTIIYVPDGGTFKWGEAENDWRGFTNITTIDDQANAGVQEAASDGNIEIANGGWYTLHVETQLGTNDVKYTFHFYPAEAYVMGSVTDNAGWDENANGAWALTAPADASGLWESPAFVNAGELRAYIKVPGRSWYTTEFTLYRGDLYWRTVDIPQNWAENVGSEYSVSCAAGQKLYVDFNLNTGEVR